MSFEDRLHYWVERGFPSDMLKIAAIAQRYRYAKHNGTRVSDFARGNHDVKLSDLKDVPAYQIPEFRWFFPTDSEDERRRELALTLVNQFNFIYRRGTSDNQTEDTKSCAWCKLLFGDKGGSETETFHKDHILPLQFFPDFDDDWNIQWLCATHNSIKGSFPIPIQSKFSLEEWRQIIVDHINMLSRS